MEKELKCYTKTIGHKEQKNNIWILKITKYKSTLPIFVQKKILYDKNGKFSLKSSNRFMVIKGQSAVSFTNTLIRP